MDFDCKFQLAVFAFFSENFWCLCLLIIIPNAYHTIANNRGFPYLRKSEGKHKMATRILNKSWADDQSLNESLRNYNRQGLQRKEILSFMVRDFGEYTWSLHSLDRRLSYFNIYRNDKSDLVENVKSAINEELMGPGRLLGYSAMHLKIKIIRGLNVPRDLVYAATTDLDSDGLKMRQPGNKKPKEKGTFISDFIRWT